MYKNIQLNPTVLINELKKLSDEFVRCGSGPVNRNASNLNEAMSSQESYYYWIRQKYNFLSESEKSLPSSSALFIFLNKTCFRGIYRMGPNGFNVPFGNYKNPVIYTESHIRNVSSLIKNVIFTHCSFVDALSSLEPGDFVYTDPPYANSFTSYTKEGFTLENHQSLFKICKGLKQKNVKLLMSNSNTKLITDIFYPPYFNVQLISCKRSINSKNPGSRINEVLITN
jgi:DNA adenine methylase